MKDQYVQIKIQPLFNSRSKDKEKNTNSNNKKTHTYAIKLVAFLFLMDKLGIVVQNFIRWKYSYSLDNAYRLYQTYPVDNFCPRNNL